MNTQNIDTYINGLIEKLGGDGYSQSVIKNTVWILNFFKKYCIDNEIELIDVSVMVTFLKEKFDIDYYNPTAGMQVVLRRPLLILYEFYQSGSFCKTHQKERKVHVPEQFNHFYIKYHEHVNQQDIVIKSKKRKCWVMEEFLMYLSSINVYTISDLTTTVVDEYVNSLTHYAKKTLRIFKSILREILDWMYKEKLINFSGKEAFPLIRKAPRTSIISYYSKEELERLLATVDVSKRNGIRDLAILSLFIYLGIRVSDVANLKIKNIDWNINTINIIQQKTGNSVTLPLIDEVKFPLLDYIKNYRYDSNLPYVFISTYAPHNRLGTAAFKDVVNKYMIKAQLDFSYRHHGPHSLRHSLATSLMNNNVPISAISSVLGHSSTRTTEIYVTVDEQNLSNLALEVPNGQ